MAAPHADALASVRISIPESGASPGRHSPGGSRLPGAVPHDSPGKPDRRDPLPAHSPARTRANALYIALNVSSSIGIVIANKWVFARERFDFGTLLTVIHFVATFVGLEICARCGLFERKRIPIAQVLGLCAAFSAFVVLTNLSLQYNSVGFYQMAKVLTTPCIVVIQTIFYKASFSAKIQAALAVTCIGVAISSATDVQVNFLGTIVALAGVAAASLYQIWVGTRQKDLNVNSFQLLYYQAPISAVMLAICVPFLDNMTKLSEYDLSVSAIVTISISAFFAFFVNLSTFLIIGKTSAVTYNVVGHFKLCAIIVIGFVVFGSPVVLNNILGILVALTGVFWYSYIKLNP